MNMMNVSRRVSSSVLLVAAIMMWGSAANAAQIAQLLEQNGDQMFRLTNNGGINSTFTANGPVWFTYQNLSGLPAGLQGFQDATLKIDATSIYAAIDDGILTNQVGFVGTFSVVRNTPFGGLTNLLSGTFDIYGTISGASGGNQAAFGDSNPPVGEVAFTSDFVAFAPGSAAFTFGMSNLLPALTIGAGDLLSNFDAAGTGTFSATVPEPGTLVLVPALIGLALRRRRGE